MLLVQSRYLEKLGFPLCENTRAEYYPSGEEAFPENESAQENVTVLNPHYNAAGRVAETAEIVKSSTVQAVLIPLSIGVSVIVLFLALYWGYLQRRVQCYAIKDGKKQNLLGNLFWRRENVFH